MHILWLMVLVGVAVPAFILHRAMTKWTLFIPVALFFLLMFTIGFHGNETEVLIQFGVMGWSYGAFIGALVQSLPRQPSA
jgi:hypothetical protein